MNGDAISVSTASDENFTSIYMCREHAESKSSTRSCVFDWKWEKIHLCSFSQPKSVFKFLKLTQKKNHLCLNSPRGEPQFLRESARRDKLPARVKYPYLLLNWESWKNRNIEKFLEDSGSLQWGTLISRSRWWGIPEKLSQRACGSVEKSILDETHLKTWRLQKLLIWYGPGQKRFFRVSSGGASNFFWSDEFFPGKFPRISQRAIVKEKFPPGAAHVLSFDPSVARIWVLYELWRSV